MRFIGGKSLLLNNIVDVINENTKDVVKIGDLFTGSGIVTAENLLLFAEEVMSRRLSYPDSFEFLRQNKEIVCLQ